MSMDPKTVAGGVVVTNAGAITAVRLYNCTVTRAAAGLYDVTIGEGGVDNELSMPTCIAFTGGAGGAGTARAASLGAMTDTVKRLVFKTDAGAAVDPDSFIFEFQRFPPLPLP